MVEQPEVAYTEARKILEERFGNNTIIGVNFEKRLATWPKINPGDAGALQEFSDFLRQVQIASKHIVSLKVYNYPSQIQPLVEKLPSWYKSKWSERVMKFQKVNGKETFPSFEEFVNHLSHEAERTNIPQLSPIRRQEIQAGAARLHPSLLLLHLQHMSQALTIRHHVRNTTHLNILDYPLNQRCSVSTMKDLLIL
jgi:hypothetical protein